MNKITKKVVSTALVVPLLYGNSFASAEKKPVRVNRVNHSEQKSSILDWKSMSPLQKTAAVGIPLLGVGLVSAVTIKVIHDKFFANRPSDTTYTDVDDPHDGVSRTPSPHEPQVNPGVSRTPSPWKPEPNPGVFRIPSPFKPQPVPKVVTPSEPVKQESIDCIITRIQKICSFTGGEGLSYNELNDLAMFRSRFDEYCKGGIWDLNKLKKYLEDNDKDRSDIQGEMARLWPLVSKTTIENGDAIALAGFSEKQLMNDMWDHFERSSGTLTRNSGDFRRLINLAEKHDENIDLLFNQSFFDQSFVAPYRSKRIDDILSEWGVHTKILAGKKLIGSDLEDKLKSIIGKWFPGIEAEQYGPDDYHPKSKMVPILEYIFGAPDASVWDTKGDRFHSLAYSRNDAFSPTLFVKVLYAFDQEAEKLKMTPKDLDDAYKCEKKLTPQQERLREFRAAAAHAFSSMSEGCCQQLQKAINKIDNAYMAYQLSSISDDSTARPTVDQRFCQELRDEATSRAVELCPKTKDERGGPEFADFIRVTFTPLVNATDIGYRKHNHMIFRDKDLGETYKSLATKWKDSISSVDLMKDVLAKIKLGMVDSEIEQFEKYKKLPISFSNFISIVKSIDKTGSNHWKKVISDCYAKIAFELNNTDDQDDKKALQDMVDWMQGNKSISFEKLQAMVAVNFIGAIDQNSEFYKLMCNAQDLDVLFYINHLAHDGLIVING